MRHRITVQEATASVDSYGNRTYTWADLVDAWADIQAVSWSEGLTAEQRKAAVTHRMTVRMATPVVQTGTDDAEQVRPRHRVTFGNHTYEILAVVDPDGRGRYQMLETREVE